MSLFINDTEYSSFHFVGILGSGMSALAQYLAWNSIHVSGSDRLYNSKSTKRIQDILESLGCRIYKQDGSGISSDTGALVLSTAIEETNPDCAKARSLNIPVFHRSDVLAAIVNTKRSIAVAGTSGKSTVAALLFHLLSFCGKKPSLITGANLHELVDNGYIGNAYRDTSEILIVEADESDGSLIRYKPFITVFLNLSKDHKPVSETLHLFQTLANQSTHVFVNRDSTHLEAIQVSETFGLENNADFYPDAIELNNTSVTILINDTKFSTPFPGKHMIVNLLAALNICKFLECNDTQLSKASATYKGLQRRFDRIKTQRDITVIDDYAHNPEKISATLQTVQSMSPTLFVIFQPHGFGPTKFLLHEFIDVFNRTLRENDTLYLLPIYYAGGTVKKEVSSQDIAEGLKKCNGTIVTPKKRDDILSLIVSQAKSGDVVISMGARDPTLPAFAHAIAHAIDK